MRTFLLFLIAVLSASFAFGQSRAEEWSRLRQEKRKTLVSNQQSSFERILYGVEKSGLNLSFKGFYPSVASVATGSGFGGQLRYWRQHFLMNTMDFQVIGAYTTKRYQFYNLQLGRIMKTGITPIIGSGGSGGFSDFHGLRKRSQQNTYFYLDLRYSYFPQEDFFGTGTDSSEDDRTNYLLKSAAGSIVAARKLNRFALVAGSVSYLQNKIQNGTDSEFPSTQEIFSDSQAPGLERQQDYLSFIGGIALDYRDRPGNPHSGGMIGFQFTRFNDRGGEDFEFSRYTFDARQFLPLGSQQRTLALRFLTSFQVADNNARVPFYLLENLGGGEILRGYEYNRFRDRNMLYLSGEYRWEAAPAWEFALFYDTGKVFPERSDFSLDNLKYSYGFGVRFKLPDSMLIRIDTAHSEEGTRVYIKFGLASF